MGKLTDEEKSLLEKLTAKAEGPDDDDDDEIEWWEEDDKGKRRGGRMTVKRAKSAGLFSDLFGEKSTPDDKKDPKSKDSKEDDGDKGGRKGGPYFGR